MQKRTILDELNYLLPDLDYYGFLFMVVTLLLSGMGPN